MFGFFTNDRYGYDRHYGVVDEKWHRFAVALEHLREVARRRRWSPATTPETTPAGADAAPRRRRQRHRGRVRERRPRLTLRRVPQRVHDPAPRSQGEDDPLVREPRLPRGALRRRRRKVARHAGATAIRVARPRGPPRRVPPHEGAGLRGRRWAGPRAGRTTSSRRSATRRPPRSRTSSCSATTRSTRRRTTRRAAPTGLSPRLGDLRYNFFNLRRRRRRSQAPVGHHGRRRGSAHRREDRRQREPVGRRRSIAPPRQLVDLVELINGATSPDTFIAGKDVSDWVEREPRRRHAEQPAPMSADGARSRASARSIRRRWRRSRPARREGDSRAEAAALRRKTRMKALDGAGKLGPGQRRARAAPRQAPRHRSSRRRWSRPRSRRLAGFDPTQPRHARRRSTAPHRSRASNPMMRRALDAPRRCIGRAQRHACRTEAPEPRHLIGLAQQGAEALRHGRPEGRRGGEGRTATRSTSGRASKYADRRLRARVRSLDGPAPQLRRHVRLAQLRHAVLAAPHEERHGHEARAPPATTDGASCIGPRYARSDHATRRSTAASAASRRRASWTTRATRRSTCT